MTAVERVGVVGCGLMGAGFAEVTGLAGLDVIVLATGEQSAARGRQRLADSLDRAVRRGRTTVADRDIALRHITFTSDIKDLSDRQFVLEAVPERVHEKRALFAELDTVVQDPDAILASNTSSIPIMKIAGATRDPGRVIGAHFFNPVPAMPLVELVSSLRTHPTTLERTRAFVTDTLGKQTVHGADQPGFTVNALLVPYLLSAVRMLGSGSASAEEIDRGMTLGCGHPMGPLALIDLIGLDTIASVADAMYEELKEPLYAPPPRLLRMIEAGRLGRKTRQGFHTYS
ncbi:3-hydroxybutyryl-CoA dehydrogenase [Streptomyces sp. NBRC 109706]|uniref:3-hydroxybutyryl-CoA dehydrogenase n=1 Tax=Streptomyces sp. NBRC 109706 TaxID=1550035 RepID=UPI0007803467|nr:3-hydroxybutyryl-CoA dehydrogenase [Streptomyces sp. NBRC 109706]